MIFRFDDVSGNSDWKQHEDITSYLLRRYPYCRIIWAVSPLVHDSQINNGRVFPSEWNALSDYRIHYRLNKLSSFPRHEGIEVATHGLIHCDHRLMDKGAQELSIVLSASLTGAKMFVPPFNKWNKDTEDICQEHDIELIKWEDGWLSMEHNKYNFSCKKWYLHARHWDVDKLNEWLKG